MLDLVNKRGLTDSFTKSRFGCIKLVVLLLFFQIVIVYLNIVLKMIIIHDINVKNNRIIYYRNDCISCLPDLITAPELVTALDSTVKILLVTLLYH